MAGAFRIAEGYVEVTADQSSYDRSMDRLKSTRHEVKVGVQLDDVRALSQLKELTRARTLNVTAQLDKSALSRLKLTDLTVNVKPLITDSALRRVQTQLDRLTAERMMSIRVSVDTRVAADELRNLTRRQRVRLGVDVDTRVAADDLANLARTRTTRINTDLRTGDTRARLDALARDRRVGLDVDVRGGALAGLTSGAGGLGALSSSFSRLAAAAVGALPTVASLGQSLVAMAPLAAVAVPAVLSLATAFAAIKIGMSGVGDAIKASLAPATSSGSSAAASLRAVRNAQEALGKASQGVRDAEVNAAAARVKAARDIRDAQQALGSTVQEVADANHQALESVAQAERDLTSAQRTARQAQLDLTAARKAAKAELEDLNNQLIDSKQAQQEDTFAVADAEQNLAAVKAKGAAATQEELGKAQLAYDKAVQQLAEQTLQTKRLQDQTTTANKAGVEGSGTVTAAKQAIVTANQALADKTQALSDAQTAADRAATNGAARVAKAERDLSDARAAATKAATDGARSIADANQAVVDAARSLADAQNSGALAVNKTANALAKLAPNARSFVAAIVAQRAAWSALRLDVQNTLFQGLSGSFTTMANSALPSLRAGLTGTAGILNTMAKNAMSAVTNLAKTGELRTVFAGLNEGLKPLSRIPGQLITGLAQLSEAAAPAFKRLTTAAGAAADGIMKKLGASLADGSLTKSIDHAIDIAKQFGHVIGDAFGILSNIMKAAGTNALGTIGALLKELRKVTAMPEVQAAMKNIFAMINAFGKLLSGAIGTVFGQLIMAFGKIAPAVTKMLNSLGDIAPLLGGILLATNPILGLFVLLAPVIGKLIKPIVGIVDALGPVLKTIGQMFGLLGPVLAILLPPIRILVTMLGAALKPIVAALGPVLKAAAHAVGDLMSAISPLLPVIGAMVASLGPVLTPILHIIGDLFKALAPVFVQLGKSLLPPFLRLTKTLGEMFQKLEPVLGKALEQLGNQGLVPIIAALGIIIGKLVDAYADQLFNMFQQLLPIIPQLIPVVVQLAKSISQVLLAVAPMLPQIMLMGTMLLANLLPAVLPLIPPLSRLAIVLMQLATDVLTKYLIPALMSISGGIEEFKTKLQPVIDAVKAVASGIVDAFTWLYDVLLGHSIIPDIVHGITGWFSGLWTKAKQIFNGLVRDIVGLWNGLWSTVRNAWNRAWSGLKGAFNSARSWMGSAFSSIRNTISGTWSGLWNGVKSTFSSIINTVTSKIGSFASGTKTAFRNLRDGLGSIWNGIRSKFSAPVRFVVDTVYNQGIRRMWNSIAGQISSKIKLPSIPLGFNTGGVVPGSGTRDTVDAKLTPGERILSLAQVSKLGGHRGIDAMLGQDRPTGTGGNPSAAQDRKTRQPVPAFSFGGIVGSIADSIGSTVSAGASWAKDLVVGGLQAAARKAVTAMVQPLINRIPGGGFGSLLKDMSGKALSGILGFFGDQDKKTTGGPAVQRALSWAHTQAGKPYQWGGDGNPSFDCSGLVSAIESVIRGQSPHRRWATGAFSGDTAPPGWVRNLVSPFMIGITNAGVGHTAGTLGGVNVESRGGDGILVGSRARGYNNSLFTDRYGFQPATMYDNGGVLAPGATMAVNKTGRPERVLTADQTAQVDALLLSAQERTPAGDTYHYDFTVNLNGGFDLHHSGDRKKFATEMVEEMQEAMRQLENSRRRSGVRR